MKIIKNNWMFILPILAVLLLIHAFITSPLENYKIKDLGTSRSVIEFQSGNSFETDNIFLPYVKEYIQDAYSHNINMDSISNNYMGIYLDETPYGIYGVTYDQGIGYNNYTLITPYIKESRSKLRTLVYHEMSHHFIGKDHCHIKCNEIMSAKLDDKNFYNDWQKQKETLFNKTKHDSL